MGKREAAKNALRKLGPKEGKQSNLGWYLGALYLPAMIVYLLIASRSLSNFVEVAFFGIIMGITLPVLGFLKSDDEFYRNLDLDNLVWAIVAGAAMTGLSWGLSDQILHRPESLLSINSIGYPFTDSTTALATNSFGLVPTTSSIFTTFIWLALGGLVMAATVEELFKLVFIAEGQKRWKNGLTLSRGVFFVFSTLLSLFIIWFVLLAAKSFNLYTYGIIAIVAVTVLGLISFKALSQSIKVPGAVGYVAVPVGFWACLHALGAYLDPIMVIPAFVNGIILAIYLLKRKCILGCIVSHWIYNSGILLLVFITGRAGIPAGTPLVPTILSTNYYQTSVFILELFLLLPLILWALGFWLLPSLRGKNQ